MKVLWLMVSYRGQSQLIIEQNSVSTITILSYIDLLIAQWIRTCRIWAVTCDFQQRGILTSVDSSDQTAPMRRLIWGFAGRTYHIVGNPTSPLNIIIDLRLGYKYLTYVILVRHSHLGCTLIDLTVTYMVVTWHNFCVTCKAWSTHRDHVSVGVDVCIVTFGFRKITFEEMHKFHSKLTEG